MAITYPLDVPNFPDSIEGFRWGIRTSTLGTESPHSFVQQIQALPGKMLTCEFSSVRLQGGAKAEEWITFMMKLNGRQGTFLIGDPFRRSPRGSALGDPVIDGADQTGTTINTRGWTASETGLLLYGDMFQVGQGNNTRLYKVMESVDSDASGNASIEIWPNLRDKPIDGAGLTLNDAKGVFRLANSENFYDWNTGEITRISLAAGEAL